MGRDDGLDCSRGSESRGCVFLFLNRSTSAEAAGWVGFWAEPSIASTITPLGVFDRFDTASSMWRSYGAPRPTTSAATCLGHLRPCGRHDLEHRVPRLWSNAIVRGRHATVSTRCRGRRWMQWCRWLVSDGRQCRRADLPTWRSAHQPRSQLQSGCAMQCNALRGCSPRHIHRHARHCATDPSAHCGSQRWRVARPARLGRQRAVGPMRSLLIPALSLDLARKCSNLGKSRCAPPS